VCSRCCLDRIHCCLGVQATMHQVQVSEYRSTLSIEKEGKVVLGGAVEVVGEVAEAAVVERKVAIVAVVAAEVGMGQAAEAEVAMAAMTAVATVVLAMMGVVGMVAKAVAVNRAREH